MDTIGFISGTTPLTEKQVKEQRKANGQCETCAMQCFEVYRYAGFKRKKKLTNDVVIEGICLRCNPEAAPKKDTLSAGNVTQSSSSLNHHANTNVTQISSSRMQSASSQENVPSTDRALGEYSPLSLDKSKNAQQNWTRGTGKVMTLNAFKSDKDEPVKPESNLPDESCELKPPAKVTEREPTGTGEEVHTLEEEQSIEVTTVEPVEAEIKEGPPKDKLLRRRSSMESSSTNNFDDPSRQDTCRRSTMNQMASMLWSLDIGTVCEYMVDLHNNSSMQTEAFKVIKDRLNTGGIDDFISVGGTLFAIDAIEEHFVNREVVLLGFEAMQLACIKADVVVDTFIENDGLIMINNVFVYHERDGDLLCSGSKLLSDLANNRDRAELITANGLLPNLVDVARDSKYDSRVRATMSKTLSRISSYSPVARKELEILGY